MVRLLAHRGSLLHLIRCGMSGAHCDGIVLLRQSRSVPDHVYSIDREGYSEEDAV
jgi:hypothetical protein